MTIEVLVGKTKKPMAKLINKLKEIRELDPDEGMVICANIFHDGSFSIVEYNEESPEDSDVLEQGSTAAELDDFLVRKNIF